MFHINERLFIENVLYSNPSESCRKIPSKISLYNLNNELYGMEIAMFATFFKFHNLISNPFAKSTDPFPLRY